MPRVTDSNPQIKSNLSFTGAKLDWMTAAAYDRRLKPSDFRIAFTIAQHANEKTGKAFPSQETIADLTGTSLDTVQRAVKLLAETGWLKLRRSRGYDPKKKTWETRNIYWLRHDNVLMIFDAMADSKRKRRNRNTTLSSRTDAAFTSRTHAALTPSVEHLQKVRESTDRDGYSMGRELVLMRVVQGGK